MVRTLKDEKVLITGFNGFMGPKVFFEARKRGFTNLRITDTRKPKVLPEGVEFVQADVTDKASLEKAVEGCHAIIHVADLFSFIAPWEKLYAVNVLGTRNICEAAIKKKVKRMVRFSSGSIYKPALGCKEDSPVDPIDPYAMSKLLGEFEASKYNGVDNFTISLLRPGVIFDEDSEYAFARIVATQAVTAKYLGTKLLPGAGTAKGPYVHAEDVVGAALHIYEKTLFTSSRNPADMAFNINADDAVSPLEIAEMADVNVRKSWLGRLLKGHMPEIHVTKPLMQSLADACGFAVDKMKMAGIIDKETRVRPVLEPGEAIFMYCKDMSMDASKIKGEGYQVIHSCQYSMPEAIRGIDRRGIMRLFF